jgi:hypothetical protein
VNTQRTSQPDPLCTSKNIKENFLSFRDVSADTSGESLSKELLTFIDEAGLDRMKMRSQCYDGAGKVKGIGPRIQKQLASAALGVRVLGSFVKCSKA